VNRYSEKQISAQESLTVKRLDNIFVGYQILSQAPRPEQSLVELMHWAKNIVVSKDRGEWIPFIHNKISIDGSFLQFCEESGVAVKALHTDAITSWQSDFHDEHFVGVGIFHIQKGDLKFYHCGLFHKGNQNEDEVSFFVLVKKEDFEDYRIFRNEYETWQNKRERDSQEIEVIGGDSIPYDPNVTWDDVFLVGDLKDRIINSINGFLSSKALYEKLKVPWKRGLGFWGNRGTGKTSTLRAIMAQYPQLKPVTIQPGHSTPDELLEEAFEYAEKHAPSLLFFEDLQELMRTIDIRHFLQLLDGLQKRDGILTIVTGNDFSNLEENLKSRPRRFDSFFEFPLPDITQSIKYLNRYLADILSSKKIESIAKKTVRNKLTYAHLQELYFNAVFIAIPEGREVPSVVDIDLSLEQILREKKSADSDFIVSKRDLTDEFEEESGEKL
jgi:hypothetical protein